MTQACPTSRLYGCLSHFIQNFMSHTVIETFSSEIWHPRISASEYHGVYLQSIILTSLIANFIYKDHPHHPSQYLAPGASGRKVRWVSTSRYSLATAHTNELTILLCNISIGLRWIWSSEGRLLTLLILILEILLEKSLWRSVDIAHYAHMITARVSRLEMKRDIGWYRI